jgi:YHS domain-containing protein
MKNIGLFIFILIISTAVNGQENARLKNANIDSKHLAMSGYDPVSYFKPKKALKGKSSITAEFEGIKYQFANADNKNLFLQSPSSYQAEYGGWCAYAMGAKNEKVEVDPETFKIINGKLYLFYNKFFNNTLESWNENEAALKISADKNWSNLIRR